jgi:hypothetical protein
MVLVICSRGRRPGRAGWSLFILLPLQLGNVLFHELPNLVRSGLAHVIIGSVAESVARTARCPVLSHRFGIQPLVLFQAAGFRCEPGTPKGVLRGHGNEVFAVVCAVETSSGTEQL